MLAPTFALLNPAAFDATVQRSTPPVGSGRARLADDAPSFADALARESTPAEQADRSPTDRERAESADDAARRTRDSRGEDRAERAPEGADRAPRTDAAAGDADAGDADPAIEDAGAPADAGPTADPVAVLPGGIETVAAPVAPPVTGTADPGVAESASAAHSPPAALAEAAATAQPSVSADASAAPPDAPEAAARASAPVQNLEPHEQHHESRADASREAASRAALAEKESADASPHRVAAPEHIAPAPDTGVRPQPAPSRFLEALARTGDAARAASTPTSPTEAAFGAQVSRGLESALRAETGSVTLRLSPASLGALRIDLRVDAGHVAAQFHASTREAHDLLNAQMTSLRSALEARGLTVRSVEVQPPAPGADAHAARDWGAGSQHTGTGAHAFGSEGRGSAGHPAFGGREDPGRFTPQDAPLPSLGDPAGDDGPRPVILAGALDAVA